MYIVYLQLLWYQPEQNIQPVTNINYVLYVWLVWDSDSTDLSHQIFRWIIQTSVVPDKLLFNVGVDRHNFVVISQDLCTGSEFGIHVKHDRLVNFDGNFRLWLFL